MDNLREVGRAFCDKACSTAWKRTATSIARELEPESLRLHRRLECSTRMKVKNPMWMPGVVERTAHHRPPTRRGGNGAGMTQPQRLLSEALPDLSPEYPVTVGRGRHAGYPTAYKVDLAHPPTKLAVEVDGHSHYGKRKVLDAKKDGLLTELGWTVLRFSNAEVTADTVGCALTVMSTISRLKARTPTLSATSGS